METTRVAGITQIGPRYHIPDNNCPYNPIYFLHGIPWQRMPILEAPSVIEGYKIPYAKKEYE
jgi:hypothetical protein